MWCAQVKCSVLGCYNLGVYKFPNGKELRKKWETAIRRPNFEATVYSKLCGSHFKNDDYIQEGHLSGGKFLKAGVVPSVFLWTEQPTQVQKMPNIKCEMEDPLTTSPDFGPCRFCEATGEHSNMISAVMGERVNYCDMLLECFNVFLSTNETTSSLICSQCATRLRDALDFKQLVLRAQSGLRQATIEVEVSASQGDMDVAIKQEPVEPAEPEQPEQPEELSKVVVKLEPMEPELDIVEHGLTRKPDIISAVSEDNVWTGNNDYGMEPKRRRLENMTNRLGGVEEETYADQNSYAGHPESVEKFLGEYYNAQDDDQEESDSVFEMPDDKDVIEMDEESVFLNTGCGCKLACMDKFDRNDVLKSRLDCLEQDYYCYHHINHLNLMMLGVLSATADISSQTIGKGRYIPKTKHRAHVGFWFRGSSVCKKFFLFVHGLNSKRYEKVLRCFRETGVEAVTHGNKKSLMTKQQRSDVVTFLSNFAEQNCLVLTGRSLDDTDLHILPSSMTRTSIYERYVRAYKQDNKYPVSRPLWYRVWDNFCPHVTVSLPSESCRTCGDFISDLSRFQPDHVKKICLNKALDHLNHVQVQRAYYQSIVAQVGPLGMMGGASLGDHAPCSYDGLVHYSFDYLQNIHLPHYHDKLGPLDFLDGYKVSLFGISIEPVQKFVLYVIPEYIHKGINLVVSLLHHFFETYGLGETNVVCHAVANQNRNSTIIQYALWRVIMGLHKSFQLSFLPSGHAKFAPDLNFGLFKSKFRESDVHSLMDICHVASLSDSPGSIIGVIVANETGKSYVNTYNWKTFFSEHFPGSIPDLPSFAHFKTDSTNPGSVMCSALSPNDYSDPIRVFDSTFGTQIPNILQPQPLPVERQEYLYKNIRSFVAPECQDLLCPVPKGLDSSVSNKVKEQTLDTNCIDNQKGTSDTSVLLEVLETKGEQNKQSKHKTNACSYCGEVGHRNQMKQGKYVCTKRQLASESSADGCKDVKPCEQCVSIDLDSSTDCESNPNVKHGSQVSATDHLDPKVEQDEQSVAENSLQDPDSDINVTENGGKEEMDDEGAEKSDQNTHSYCPDKVEKFPEEYYFGQDEDEEEDSNECDEIQSDELVDVKDFRCDCKFPCRNKFDTDDILKSILDCRDQDYYCQHHFNHLNLIILGALNAMVNTNSQSSSKRNCPKQRERTRIVFTFRGIPVCKKFFLFAHGLGEHKFKNLVKTFKKIGVEAQPHYASTKSLMTPEQKTDVVAFIRNFSEQNSIVLPGRSLSNTDLYILPNIMSGTYIFERYIRACKADKKCPLSRPLWKRAWDTFFPNGTFNLPSQSCKTCQDFVSELSKPQTEDTKIKCLNNALDHLNHVQVQKAYYQSTIAQVITLMIMNKMSLGQHVPCSYDGLAHYSFDYLQQVHLPHYPDQEGPLNFLDTYKVSLFGVAIEPLQKFILYVIPENIPKETNLVVSLLHHFFETYGLGETNVVCHAVANQNKDSTIIQYALWRVMSGLHKTFQLSFLPLGHTKFAPDVHFGFFKSKFRQSAVNCVKDISEIASAYSDITSVLVGNEAGQAYVNTCDWKKFFADINPAPIPKNLTSFVHFKTDASNSGTVMCSKSSPNDYSDRIKVFSKLDTKMPNIIQPQMPFERQNYLYENVRCHVSPEYQDLLCPIPKGPDGSTRGRKRQNKPSNNPNSSLSKVDKDPVNPLDLLDANNGESKQNVGEVNMNPGNGKRKTVVCSYCGISGHRNLLRHGVYSCKKRKLDMEGSTSTYNM